MKRLLLLALCLLIGCGCMPASTSSGLMLQENIHALPPCVPKKVGCALFTGQSPINSQATELFLCGLLKLGFDVVERLQLDKILEELELQHTGLISPETRQILGRQLGLEGIFVGNITGRSTSFTVNTFLNLKLIDVQTGKVLWSGSFCDPRMFALTTDAQTSIIYTTREALRMLGKDLHEISCSD